jgi:pentatricopeptide repeat-containing protein PET309
MNSQLAFLLRQNLPDQYDKVWKLYLAAGSPSKYNSAVLSYLSESSNYNHQERAWTVFQNIPSWKRTDDNYHNILFSQHLTNPPRNPHVVSICQQALSTPSAGFCIQWSLVYATKNRNWSLISEIWRLIYEIPDCSRMQLRKYLDAFRNQDFPAFSLARDLVSLAEYLELGNGDRQLLEFALHLFHRFIRDEELPRLTPTSTLLQLFRKYRSLGFVRVHDYLKMIDHFQSSNTRPDFVQSIIFYRQFRLDMPDEPLGKLLTRLFDRAVAFEMTDSVAYFLDELAHFQGKPTIAAYREALQTFSKAGDVSKVHRTFDRFLADHGNPKSRRLLSPLLSVHAGLGDVPETQRQFDRISAEFGLHPNTVCWNILIQAYATAGDVLGAASTFANMMKQGEKPSSHTFGTIMALFAKRGDIQNVRRLIREAMKMRVEITRPMIDTIVRVYLKHDKAGLAESLISANWEKATGGSPVQLWNTLLWHYAFKVSKLTFSRILGDMGKLGLIPDAGTYGAIIFSHAIAQQPDTARSMLRKMAQAGIEPTEQHYSIVMFAYMKKRNRDMVHAILREMQTRFGRVGLSASLVNLQMQLQRDLENAKRSNTPAESLSFPHAEKALMASITQFNDDPSQAKALSFDSSGSAKEHFPAMHYQHLIRAYGDEGAIDKARQALDQYLQSRQSTSSSDQPMAKLPFGFVKCMMSAHLKAHEFMKVEEYWNLLWPDIITFAARFNLDQMLAATSKRAAKRVAKSKRAAKPTTATGTESPGSTKPTILRSQMYILNVPLEMYMRSLGLQNKYQRLHQVVNEVQEAGFVLTAHNWSSYIELLTLSDEPSDQIMAFKLFEKKFQPNFPGWFYMQRGFGWRPSRAPVTILHLEGRVGGSTPRRVMGKIARRHWLRIQPNYMHPSYRTMVYLARRLQLIRRDSIEYGSVSLSELFHTTPKTIRILADMPQLPDKYQGQLLRGGEKEPEPLPKPIRLASTNSGLLGPTGKLKPRSRELAKKEPAGLDNFEPSDTIDEPSLTGLIPDDSARAELNALTQVLPRVDRIAMEMQLHEDLEVTGLWRKRADPNIKIRAKLKARYKATNPKIAKPFRLSRGYSNSSSRTQDTLEGRVHKRFAMYKRRQPASKPLWKLYNPRTGWHEPHESQMKRRDRNGRIRRRVLHTRKKFLRPSSPEMRPGYSSHQHLPWRPALREDRSLVQ